MSWHELTEREIHVAQLAPILRDLSVAIRDAVRSYVAYAAGDNRDHWLTRAASLAMDRPGALIPRLGAMFAPAGLRLQHARAYYVRDGGGKVELHVLVLVHRAAHPPASELAFEAQELELQQRYNGYWLRTFTHVLADVLMTTMAALAGWFDPSTAVLLPSPPPPLRDRHFHHWTAAESGIYLPALPTDAQRDAARFFAHAFDRWTEAGAASARMRAWWSRHWDQWGPGRSGYDFIQSLARGTVQRPALDVMFAHWAVTSLAASTSPRLDAMLPAGTALDVRATTDWVYVTQAYELAHVWQWTGTESTDTLDGDTEEEMFESFYRRTEALVKASDDLY